MVTFLILSTDYIEGLRVILVSELYFRQRH
jgi:hypothetical protein